MVMDIRNIGTDFESITFNQLLNVGVVKGAVAQPFTDAKGEWCAVLYSLYSCLLVSRRL